MTAQAGSPHCYLPLWDRTGPLWCVLAIVSGTFVFLQGLASLGKAWQAPEYSHGPLIPLLSLYLFLRQLRNMPAQKGPVTDRGPGLLLVIVALAIALVGKITRIPDIVTYAMILWTFGLLLIGFGWRTGRQFWPPVLHLAFMLHLPTFVYWKLSLQLQFISSEIGVSLIHLMGIPVFLEGNIIDLGVWKLHVAEACSGLRYLFPVMSFSYIFAVLYQGPTWHKAVLLLSAAPITLLMNAFRVGMIGVMVDNYGIEHAEGFMHLFEGWVIFIACVAMLFGLARLMQRAARDHRPFHEALDLDYDGLWPQIRRVASIKSSTAMIACAVVTSMLAVAWYAAPARQVIQPERAPLVLFPRTFGDWTAGPMEQLEPRIKAILRADDYLSTIFRNSQAAAPVELFVAYYNKLTEGQGIHSPEVCISAGGWEMSEVTQRNVLITSHNEATWSIPVNRVIIQKGLTQQLVYCCFEQRGRRMTSDYTAKAMTLLDAVTRGRTDGALIRFITPIASGESETSAEQRLNSFLGESLDTLPRFIPE